MSPRSVHTPLGDAPVLPVLVLGMGAYLTWFGVHYWRSDTPWPTDPLKAVLTGKGIPAPDRSAGEAAIKSIVTASQAAAAASTAAAGTVNPPTGTAATTQAGGGGERIAAQGLRYIGSGYVYGGNASRVGDWDCSSFVSYVLGHDLGYPLPGGRWGDPGFPPHTHGPTTSSYLLFGQAVARSAAVPGDLIVSSEHMGIVTGSGTYVSARTPVLGTNVGSYASEFPGGTPVFRRVT